MPNTLGHIGVQGVATRLSMRGADPRWILLGCLIPDLPWILLRLARFVPYLDPYEVQLYGIAQASLACCLLLSGALALLSARPRLVFSILALNSLLHLLLDALEVKWGSGVHLLAPFSWRMLNFGWFWPESAPSLLMTALGLGFGAWCCLRRPGPFIPVSAGSSAGRIAAAFLLLAYLITPALLRHLPENANNRFIATLKDRPGRPGRHFECERGRVVRSGGGLALRIFSGEAFHLEGAQVREGELLSVRGRFVNETTLRVEEAHRHPAGLRDAATYVGIGLIGLIWLLGAAFGAPKAGENPPKLLASDP